MPACLAYHSVKKKGGGLANQPASGTIEPRSTNTGYCMRNMDSRPPSDGSIVTILGTEEAGMDKYISEAVHKRT